MGTETANVGVLGVQGTLVLLVYLFGLLGIGVVGRLSRREDSVTDHVLAGRSLGLLVLFFTLYATQYSGNTLVGFAGNAYRSGFLMMMSVTAMMAVVAVIGLFAPRLHTLSHSRGYITPGDFVEDRFGSRGLAISVSVLGIWAMANYILSNLIAIGAIVETSTGGRIPYVWAVVGLSLIMVIYETMGGMRSVAWTDLLQGLILMIGIGSVFALVFMMYDDPVSIGRELAASKPELFTAPSGMQKRGWFSTVILFAFGISVYPHLVQRIFAARDDRSLKRSLQLMVFMPFVTTMLVVLVAIVGLWRFDGLDRAGSERILVLLINDMATRIPALSILLLLFVSASVAAIMSTVDSALLSLSSLFTQDLYRPLKPGRSEAHYALMGKWFSWLVMVAMAGLALILPSTVWWLIQLKLEFFIQITPAILIGVTGLKIRGRTLLTGLLVGTGLTLIHTVLVQAGMEIPARPWGIHAGVWGLLLNLVTVVLLDRSRWKTTANFRLN